MTLPESSWVRYINRLSAINKTAARKFEAYLNTHDVMSKSGRKAALDYAAALVQKYGEGAAAVSCEMYDAVAAASGAILPAAEPAAVASYGEVAKTINGIMKTSQNASYIASGVERLVKQAGADTTLMNARRDGAEFAWVPHGDTCSFCVMLASNGWQTASKKTIKGDHAEHIHANCDCTFAIRFDGKSNVEGYDPDKYREIYDNAEGDTWQEKLNSMRRDEYAANADKIRAQKREAYERRNQLKRKPEALSRVYVNNSEQLYKNLQNVTPIRRFEDVAIHGVPGQALVEYETTSGIIKQYNPAELADMIRENPDYHGGNVRLLSCGAGAEETGFAQALSNELGKRVMAPTETLWVAENGEMFVSDSEVLAQLWYNGGAIDHGVKQPGYWKVYKPKNHE